MNEWLSWFPWWFQNSDSIWAVIALITYFAELGAFIISMFELSNPYSRPLFRPAIVWPLVFLGVLTLPVAPYIGAVGLASGALWLANKALGGWAKDTKKLVEEKQHDWQVRQLAKAQQRSLSPARMTDSADDRALSLTTD